MEYQNVMVNGKTITIPEYYQKVDSMPEDPKDSIPFMARTGNARAYKENCV